MPLARALNTKRESNKIRKKKRKRRHQTLNHGGLKEVNIGF